MITRLFKAVISLILWPIWFAYLIIVLPVFLIYIGLVNKKYYHYFLRPMSYFFCLFGGQLVKLNGNPPNPNYGPYLYIMNHESLFDHFVFLRYIRHHVTAIAKVEQFKYPLWGHVAKYYGIVPINRSNKKKAINSLKIVEDKIVDNRVSIFILPEGTRSKNGDLGEFKKGAFHIAKNTGVSIVPVIINGAYEAKNKSDWRLTPGIINIHFADTITKDFYSDISVEELRDYVRGNIKDFVD